MDVVEEVLEDFDLTKWYVTMFEKGTISDVFTYAFILQSCLWNVMSRSTLDLRKWRGLT